MKNKIIFLFLLLPVIMAGQVQVRLPDTTVVAGTTVKIPVYVDNSLTGLNVFSYQLQISFTEGNLNPTGLNKSGTMTASWGDPLFNRQSGKITFVAAGATALVGKGVLVYIVCQTMNTSSTPISFTGVAFNFFNEGSPTLTFDNGYVYKTSPPTITISPDNAILVKGETQQFTVTGQGSPPYSWGVTNPGICSINVNGFLTAINPGFARVYCTSSSGISDTTGIIEIRAMKVTLPQSTGAQGQLVTLPVTITSTTGLGIISGEVEYTFSQSILTPVSLFLEGALLAGFGEVLLNISLPGKILVSFAGQAPLAGEGTLFFIKFQVGASATGSTNLTFSKAMFNEDMTAKIQNGSFSVTTSNMSFNPNTGTMIAGNQIPVTVSGGSPPYIWESTQPSVASIWNFGGGNTANLTALSGGITKIKVTDYTGNQKLSGDFVVYDTDLKISSTSIPVSSTVLVPVILGSLPPGKSIYSMEIEFECNSSYLQFWGVQKSGTLTGNWELLFNRIGNKMSVVAACASPISGQGVLFYLFMYARPNLPVGTNAYINILDCYFNEGSPTVKLENGYVTGAPAYPNILVSPILFTEQLPQGVTVNRQITVTNSGIHNLVFHVSSEADTLSGMINLPLNDSIVEPGNSKQISFTISTFGFLAGIHSSEIKIQSNDQDTPMFTVPVSIEVTSTVGIDQIELVAGWNLISIDVIPENNTPASIFSALIGENKLVYVSGFQNQEGVFFDPYGPDFLNTLINMNPGEGYWVKVNSSCTLIVEGTPIPPDFAINLKVGWNLIGYWLPDPIPPLTTFQQLIDQGILVYVSGFQNQEGVFFDPNGPDFLNTLLFLKNSEGYWVKMTEDFNGFSY
jgi:hypothetical protein